MESKQFEKILKQNSMYITRQRNLVFSLLSSESKPISLPQIAKKLQKELDLVTVYRTVDSFEKLGIVKKVYAGWKYKIELSEKFRPHHHHLTCSSCSGVIDLDHEPELERALTKISRKYSFRIDSHEFELYGLCKKCSGSS